MFDNAVSMGGSDTDIGEPDTSLPTDTDPINDENVNENDNSPVLPILIACGGVEVIALVAVFLLGKKKKMKA